MNKFLRLQALAFIILFVISIASALVYEIVWFQEDVDYKLYLSISLIYIVCFLLYQLKNQSITQNMIILRI